MIALYSEDIYTLGINAPRGQSLSSATGLCYYYEKDCSGIVTASHALPKSAEFSYIKVQDVVTNRTEVDLNGPSGNTGGGGSCNRKKRDAGGTYSYCAPGGLRVLTRKRDQGAIRPGPNSGQEKK